MGDILDDDSVGVIVGFEFTGDPLLEGEFVPLKRGLNVFYGLNGAGKTRMLRGMRAALLGVADDVDVGMIVHAERSTSVKRWSSGSGEPRPILIAIAQSIVSTTAPAEIIWGHDAPAEREMSLSEASRIVDQFIRDRAGDMDPDLTADLLDARLFLLVPTGTITNPSWDAWAVADISRPPGARIHAELAASERDFATNAPDDPDDYYDALADWSEANAPRALLSPNSSWVFARRRPRAVFAERHLPFAAHYLDGESLRGLEIAGTVDFGADALNLEQDPHVATNRYVAHIVDALEQQQFQDGLGVLAALAEAFRTDGGRVRRSGETVPDELNAMIEALVADVALVLSNNANRYFSAVLPDAPQLSLLVNPPSMRFARPPIEWSFGPHVLGLDALSRAEQKWADRAINHAIETHARSLRSEGDRPTITIIDEPESALHRAAEAQMSAALASFTDDPREVIVSATHSPDLLDSPAASVIEVQREGGQRPGSSLVHALDLADRNALHRLGLNPSDLLRLSRVILLVEGPHDEALLDVFLGSRLRTARVKIIPMHGARRLPETIDSQVLFKHTRAHIIALLDNIAMSRVTTVWAGAKQLAQNGDLENAFDHLKRLRDPDNKKHEYGFLSSFLANALNAGATAYDRVTPAGLSNDDIIDYLPAEKLTSRIATWDELRAEYRDDKSHGRRNAEGDFKQWLQRTYHADLRVENLRRLAADTEVPKEFLLLMNEIEARSEQVGTTWKTQPA